MNNVQQLYQHLFTPQGDLTTEALWAYTHGDLSVEELRVLQQHITTCELCKNAVEGVATLKDKQVYIKSLSTINQKIDERVEEQRRRVGMWSYRRLALAAILLLLLGISFYWINNSSIRNEKAVAQTEQPKAPAELNNASHDQGVATTASNPISEETVVAENGIASKGKASTNIKQEQEVQNKKYEQVTVTSTYGASAPAAPVVSGSISANKTVVADSISTIGFQSNTFSDAEKKSLPKELKPSAKLSKGKTAQAQEDKSLALSTSKDALEQGNRADEISADNIEAQYPGSTDQIQHYVDSLRPNKTKSSRYPIKVRLSLDATGQVSSVDFTHAPGINVQDKAELETVLKSMPFWKTRKQQYIHQKKLSVKFNY